MARPEKRNAAKDYPNSGIAKGDSYWYVKIKTGPRSSRVMRQKHPFKRSQLTSSDFLSQLYDWEDSIADFAGTHDELQDFADTIRQLGEEQRDKYDNMPEGLQQGDTGQMLEQRADACESAADEIENIQSNWESAFSDWESEVETYVEEMAAFKQYEAEVEAWGQAEPDLLDRAAYESAEAYVAAQQKYDEWAKSEPDAVEEPTLPNNTDGEFDPDEADNGVSFDSSEFLSELQGVSVDA